MQKSLRLFSALDWVVASITLLVGLWLLNGWVILAGTIALAIAWYSPAKRVSARLQKYLFKKRQTEDHSSVLLREDEFYASLRPDVNQASKASQGPDGLGEAPPVDFTLRPYTYAQVRLNSSRHNLLTSKSLDLTPSEQQARRWA